MQRSIVAGTDRVCASYPLPPGGALNSAHIQCHILGPEETPATDLAAYGLSGFILPMLDVDSAINVDTMWDNLVPKDQDAGSGSYDLDTAAIDATPEFEMGELDLEALFKVNPMAPREIFRRRKYISAASNATGYAAGTPDTFRPLDFLTTQVRKGGMVSSPSMVLFALSSPSLDQVSATVPTAPSEVEWMLYQMLEHAVENMLMFVAGLIVEGSASLPYDESAVFVANLLENDVFNDTGGVWQAGTFTIFQLTTFDVVIPGTISTGVLTSE